MQLLKQQGPRQVIRKHFMRSLSINYPRFEKEAIVFAVLFSLQSTGEKFNLTVLNADNLGIEIKLPSLLSGMYCLEVKDGGETFRKTIALQ